MQEFATLEQRPQLDKARAAAEAWLAQVPPRDLQDRLWLLWGLHHLHGDAKRKSSLADAILADQREDGGWAESDDRSSDPYSTGQTLYPAAWTSNRKTFKNVSLPSARVVYMLCKTGTAPDHPAMMRAGDYLLKTQYADGSWLAESHVKFKAQPYFENGDPHGEHQFLSTAATAWATAGLAQLLPYNASPPRP